MEAFKVASWYFRWREIKVAIDSRPIRAARKSDRKAAKIREKNLT